MTHVHGRKRIFERSGINAKKTFLLSQISNCSLGNEGQGSLRICSICSKGRMIQVSLNDTLTKAILTVDQNYIYQKQSNVFKVKMY